MYYNLIYMCNTNYLKPSPHNANLAAKGILGLGAFSLLCSEVGRTKDAQKYERIAKDFADAWELLALDSDEKKYRLVSVIVLIIWI
jgi:hypothetical protein